MQTRQLWDIWVSFVEMAFWSGDWDAEGTVVINDLAQTSLVLRIWREGLVWGREKE